jgi:hypothetical protein
LSQVPAAARKTLLRKLILTRDGTEEKLEAGTGDTPCNLYEEKKVFDNQFATTKKLSQRP